MARVEPVCMPHRPPHPLRSMTKENPPEPKGEEMPTTDPGNPPPIEKTLAEAHWGYIKGLLQAHNTCPNEIETIGFHYRSAFIHGWKHAKEDKPDMDEIQKLLIQEQNPMNRMGAKADELTVSYPGSCEIIDPTDELPAEDPPAVPQHYHRHQDGTVIMHPPNEPPSTLPRKDP